MSLALRHQTDERGSGYRLAFPTPNTSSEEGYDNPPLAKIQIILLSGAGLIAKLVESHRGARGDIRHQHQALSL